MATNMADFVPVARDGVSVEQTGHGKFRTARFTFEEARVALADEAGVVAYGGIKLGDFPEGAILLFAGVADLTVTKDGPGVTATFDGDFGVGTVVASNNNSLATTEQNIVPTTATPQAVAGATTAKGISTAAAHIDGTAGALDIYLNFLVDDADQDITGLGATDLVVSGDVTIHYLLIGDK